MRLRIDIVGTLSYDADRGADRYQQNGSVFRSDGENVATASQDRTFLKCINGSFMNNIVRSWGLFTSHDKYADKAAVCYNLVAENHQTVATASRDVV